MQSQKNIFKKKKKNQFHDFKTWYIINSKAQPLCMILPCSGVQERYEADYLKKHKEDAA